MLVDLPTVVATTRPKTGAGAGGIRRHQSRRCNVSKGEQSDQYHRLTIRVRFTSVFSKVVEDGRVLRRDVEIGQRVRRLVKVLLVCKR